MRAMEILLEGPDEILTSFFNLTNFDGKFRSDKQKNFLLSKCNAGKGVYKRTQSFSFGPNNGASGSVTWTVFCDDVGVQKITKYTGKTGEQVHWERTPEQAAKKAATGKLRQEEIVRQYTDTLGEYQKDLEKAEQAVKLANVELNQWKTASKGLPAMGFDENEIADMQKVKLDKITNAQNLVIGIKEQIAKVEQTIKDAQAKLE